MKKISLFLIALWVISLAFSIESNCAPRTYVMRIGYATKGNPLDMAAINFTEKMQKRVGDQVKVELYPAGQLGSNETMLQQLQQGTIQGVMNPPGFLGGRYDLVTILDLPYFLKTDLLSAVRILNGPLGKKLTKGLEEKGMINIRFYPEGNQVILVKFPIQNLESFKGKKIRVMQSQIQIDTYNGWGASGIPMGVPELYTALQQGTVDGISATEMFFYTMKYHEICKTLFLAPQVPTPSMLIVNKKWYEGLPSDVKKAVNESAADDKELLEKAVLMNNNAVAMMKKAGVDVITPTGDLLKDLEGRAKKVHENFLKAYPEARAIYDEFTQSSKK
jgi:C4-dicarboxylate-binding protein DctP